jgi:hypothetical protein
MFCYSAYHLILHWNRYLCSQPLTSNSCPVDWILGPVILILSLPLSLFYNECYSFLVFAIKKAPTPLGPPHFKLLPSSLDLDLAMVQRIDLVGRKLLLFSLPPPPQSLSC